jgi:hypothetical protein
MLLMGKLGSVAGKAGSTRVALWTHSTDSEIAVVAADESINRMVNQSIESSSPSTKNE